MKKMNHRYIQLVIITAMALLLTSCKDTMTLDRLSNEPKLVVYCLPPLPTPPTSMSAAALP